MPANYLYKTCDMLARSINLSMLLKTPVLETKGVASDAIILFPPHNLIHFAYCSVFVCLFVCFVCFVFLRLQ